MYDDKNLTDTVKWQLCCKILISLQVPTLHTNDVTLLNRESEFLNLHI